MPPKEGRALGQAFSNKPNCPLAMRCQGYRIDPTLVTPVLASHQSAQRSLPAIIHTLPYCTHTHFCFPEQDLICPLLAPLSQWCWHSAKNSKLRAWPGHLRCWTLAAAPRQGRSSPGWPEQVETSSPSDPGLQRWGLRRMLMHSLSGACSGPHDGWHALMHRL